MGDGTEPRDAGDRAAVVEALRRELAATRLVETTKWNKPCFVHGEANVAIIQEMKAFVALMFFKGALVDDPTDALESQGPNSRSARRMTFRTVDDVTDRRDVLADLVASAIEVEEAGLEVGPAPEPELAAELRDRLDGDHALRAAFDALTPGRRREYHLHVSGAKREETRRSRVEACVPTILAGRGLRDRPR